MRHWWHVFIRILLQTPSSPMFFRYGNHFPLSAEAYKAALNPTIDISDCANTADLWAKIIQLCKSRYLIWINEFDTTSFPRYCDNFSFLFHCWLIFSFRFSGQEASAHFDTLCCAVLLSALVCSRRSIPRVYLEEKKDGKRGVCWYDSQFLLWDSFCFLSEAYCQITLLISLSGLDVIRDRRLLLKTAVSFFEKVV